MRNNVKIEAPSIYKDFGLGDGVLCMAIDNFATEVIIKRSESDALALRGKYKSAEIQSLAEQILGRFRACCAIKDSVDILLNCRVPEALSSSASVAVALYQGLVMLFHTGKTHEEIYEDLVSDEGLMKLVSRHEIFTILYGGLSTSLPKTDLFQKIYVPPGLTGVLFMPEHIGGEKQHVLPPSYLSNLVLALNNSNFKVLGSGFRSVTIEAFCEGIELSSDTIGIFPHGDTDVLATLSLNTISVDEDLKQKLHGYVAEPLKINLQGAQYF